MNCLCTNLHCAILRSDSRSALEAEAIYRGGPLLYKPQRVPHARQPQSSCIVHSSNVERVSLCLSLVVPGLKLTALPVGVLPALAGQWDKTRKGKGVSDLSTDTYRGCVFWQCPPALAWLQVVMRRASCPQRYTTCRYWHILALRTRSGYDRFLGGRLIVSVLDCRMGVRRWLYINQTCSERTMRQSKRTVRFVSIPIGRLPFGLVACFIYNLLARSFLFRER